MRLLAILFALAVGPVCAAERAPRLDIPVPEGVALFSDLDARMTEYRGRNGERWVLLITHGEFADPAFIRSWQDLREAQFRLLAEQSAKANAPYRVEKRPISDNGTLLLFASQKAKAGKPHGQIEFDVYWAGIGTQAKGEIEWAGALEPKVDDYIRRLLSIRLRAAQ